MKKALLYLVLFSYTTIVLKPVFPTIADTVAHIFWYSAHMATVHVENGKYHVHYELQDAAKKTAPEKDANLSKSESNAEHLIVENSYKFSSPLIIKTFFHSPSSYLLHTHLNGDFPPPRA